MGESDSFRVKRARDNVLDLAREWSRAYRVWNDTDGPEEEKLYTVQRRLRVRLDAACHELVALEDA